jgi:hypothetical protein
MYSSLRDYAFFLSQLVVNACETEAGLYVVCNTASVKTKEEVWKDIQIKMLLSDLKKL